LRALFEASINSLRVASCQHPFSNSSLVILRLTLPRFFLFSGQQSSRSSNHYRELVIQHFPGVSISRRDTGNYVKVFIYQTIRCSTHSFNQMFAYQKSILEIRETSTDPFVRIDIIPIRYVLIDAF